MYLGAAIWMTLLPITFALNDTPGYIVIEEDILIKQDGSAQGRSIPGGANTWVSRQIPYNIDQAIKGNSIRHVLTAMATIEDASGCINFVSWTREPDYVNITQSGNGCYSAVGRRGGQQLINLGPGCDTVGIIMHELLHALGFWHEQNRSDRDNYVTIHRENIIKGAGGQFDRRNDNEKMEKNVKYDLKSILHYAYNAFSQNREKLDTITPKDPKVKKTELGQREKLSALDIDRIKWLYKCEEKVFCKPPYGFSNGGLMFPNQKQFDVGDRVTFSCSAGYTFIGPHTSVCKTDGHFSGAVPFCTRAKSAYYCDMAMLNSGSCTRWRHDAKWQEHQGQTDTQNTGPLTDHTYENSLGSYFYMDATGVDNGVMAFMRTRYIPFTREAETIWAILFYRNMFGDGMGTLNATVRCSYDVSLNVWWSGKETTQTTNDWHQTYAEFNPYANCKKTSKFMVVFTAVRGRRDTADIAIDDVLIAPRDTVKKYKDAIEKTLSDKAPEHDTNSVASGVFFGTKLNV